MLSQKLLILYIEAAISGKFGGFFSGNYTDYIDYLQEDFNIPIDKLISVGGNDLLSSELFMILHRLNNDHELIQHVRKNFPFTYETILYSERRLNDNNEFIV